VCLASYQAPGSANEVVWRGRTHPSTLVLDFKSALAAAILRDMATGGLCEFVDQMTMRCDLAPDPREGNCRPFYISRTWCWPTSIDGRADTPAADNQKPCLSRLEAGSLTTTPRMGGSNEHLDDGSGHAGSEIR